MVKVAGPHANELTTPRNVAPGNRVDVEAAQAEPSGATLSPVVGGAYKI